MKIKLILSGFLLACSASMTMMADSIPYPSVDVIPPATSFTAAADGDVTAYYYGGGALFNELFGLYVNGVQQGNWALGSHSSTVGESVDFGPVKAGDKLVLALNVLDTNYTLFSNPYMNPDGINHVYTTAFSGATVNDVTIPTGTYIGWEDSLIGFSDLNYNDEDLVLTNVLPKQPSSDTPEPASAWLFCAGALLTLGFGVARKRNS